MVAKREEEERGGGKGDLDTGGRGEEKAHTGKQKEGFTKFLFK